MSVSFSSTQLQVPRGFGFILEGLTREVLRDQPKDIPQYAATYFTGLLKEREASGVDPAEWAATMEDRCKKNFPFRTIRKRKAQAEEADTTENLHKPKTEDESMESTESDVDENTDEDNLGEKEAFLADPSEEECSNRLLVTDTRADGQSGTDDQERDQMAEMLVDVDTAVNETDHSLDNLGEKKAFLADPSEEESTNRLLGTDTRADGQSGTDDQERDKMAEMLEDVDMAVNETDHSLDNLGEKKAFLADPSEEESTNRLLVADARADGQSGTDDQERDQMAEMLVDVDTAVNETDHSLDNLGEKEAFQADPSEEESTNRLLVTDTHADGQTGTDDQERDQMAETLEDVDMAVNETDHSFVPNQTKLLPEAEPKSMLSSEDIMNVDIGAAADEVDDTPAALVVEKNTVDGGEYIEAAEPNEIPLYTGIANVELCAENLREIEGGILANIDSHLIEKQTPEDTASHSSPVTNSNQQKAADHHEITKEEERMETGESSIKTFQSLAHAEDGTGVAPKEESLVEVNFDDLPEGQPASEVVEKQSEEDSSTEVLQSTLTEMQPKESYELIEAATIQNQSDTQDDHESEIEVVEKDVDLKEVKGESPNHAFALAEEQENTSEFVDEAGEKTHLDKLKQEEETSNDNDNSGKESEGNCFQNEESTSNDCELKDNELTNKAEGDEEDELEGYSDIKDQAMNHDIESSASASATEEERKTFNKSAQDNLKEEEEDEEEDKDNLKALAEAQSEDTVNEKWVTLDEQVRNELEQVEVAKEEGDAGHVEDNITLICRSPADHEGDENPNKSEKDTLILPEQDTDKEECSRPQEEEDIMDIPLDDPEANRAAAKIQAGFRGHMTRKKMKPEDKAEAEERQEDRGQ